MNKDQFYQHAEKVLSNQLVNTQYKIGFKIFDQYRNDLDDHTAEEYLFSVLGIDESPTLSKYPLLVIALVQVIDFEQDLKYSVSDALVLKEIRHLKGNDLHIGMLIQRTFYYMGRDLNYLIEKHKLDKKWKGTSLL